MEACGCEVDDFASWMHGFPGFTVLGVCYMQGGLGHSERGKAQEACLGLEVVCYDNYDIQSDSLIPSFRPPLQTSVLQFQQNNTKLTTPKLRQRKQMCSGRDIKKCPISVSLIVCVFFFSTIQNYHHGISKTLPTSSLSVLFLGLSTWEFTCKVPKRKQIDTLNDLCDNLTR